MTLTAIVGALLAGIPRAAGGWPDRLEKLARRVDDLTRSQARLIDRIQDLDRELDVQRALTAHWKGEAQRLAVSNRELREHAWSNYARERMNALEGARQNLAQPQQNLYGFCNCVPSRSQVWASVQKLNDQEN